MNSSSGWLTHGVVVNVFSCLLGTCFWLILRLRTMAKAAGGAEFRVISYLIIFFVVEQCVSDNS